MAKEIKFEADARAGMAQGVKKARRRRKGNPWT